MVQLIKFVMFFLDEAKRISAMSRCGKNSITFGL